MSFRPDGFLQIWEAVSAFGRPLDASASRFSWQEAATYLLGAEWFEALNRPSEEYPGLEVVMEQDGSTAYIIDEVLSRWIFLSLLGGDMMPTYFCSPSGQIIRTFLLHDTLTPTDRAEFWYRFAPTSATVEDFVKAFLGMKDEGFAILSDSGLVRRPTKGFARFLPSILGRNSVKVDIEQGEIAPFVGWSVCVRDSESLRDASAMLSLMLGSPSRKVCPTGAPQDSFAEGSQGKRPSGRPSLQSEIIANFRGRFKDGRGTTSISEVARVLGYDRKTTRKALKAAGELDERG